MRQEDRQLESILPRDRCQYIAVREGYPFGT
jgi:hypothetical protein